MGSNSFSTHYKLGSSKFPLESGISMADILAVDLKTEVDVTMLNFPNCKNGEHTITAICSSGHAHITWSPVYQQTINYTSNEKKQLTLQELKQDYQAS